MTANPKHKPGPTRGVPTPEAPASEALSAANAMWGGRFASGPAEVMQRINTSIAFDQRLYAQDIAASQVHCKMLVHQSIISQKDGTAILEGLDTICERSPRAAAPSSRSWKTFT